MAIATPYGSLLRRLLEGGSSFADVDIQMHFGDRLTGKDLVWHVDRPNAMLHMALGLQGKRTMHAKLEPATGETWTASFAGKNEVRTRTVAERFGEAKAQIEALR